MFIITRGINQDDQDGEYFFAAFDEKPTESELIKLGFDKKNSNHLLKGGGRINVEYEWFYLIQIKNGETYDLDKQFKEL